jgi:hypothetical protein
MARYRHPKHGYYVASYGDDVAALKAAGWVLDVPAPVPVPVPHPSPDPEPAVNLEPAAPPVPSVSPRREWRPKRGR